MADVAIFNPQKEDHYSVLARNPANEDEIKLMDIWKDGKFMFNNDVYPKNRLTVSFMESMRYLIYVQIITPLNCKYLGPERKSS